MVMLDPAFATVADWGGLIGGVALVLIGVGEFFRRADPHLWPFPSAAVVLGWLSWAGLSVVEALVDGEGIVACTGADCPTSVTGALLQFASPYARDLMVAALVTAGAWVAATVWLWSRRRTRQFRPA